MTHKKLLPYFTSRLFLLIFFLISTNSCSDDWSDIELTTSCYNEFETSGIITDQKATVASDNSNPIFLLIEEESEYYFVWPCNLPLQFQQEGLEVIFSAELKALPTSEPIDTLEDGTIQYNTWDYLGIPACLTSLQIKN